MAKARRQRTWADVGISNAGFAETARALKFALGWGLATAELGREPENVDEYASVMKESRTKAFRDQRAFRAAFPSELTPGRMNRATGSQQRYDETRKRLKNLGAAYRDMLGFTFVLGSQPADV